MAKKKKRMGLRYFLLSFLITFSVITLIGFFVIAEVINPSQTLTPTDNVKKENYTFTDSDSFTLLCIGWQRDDVQAAFYSLIRLDAPQKRIYITSFPADTATGEKDGRKTARQTAAYGGTSALVASFEEVFDIEIDRFIKIEEASFAALADRLGSVTYDCGEKVEHYDENGFLEYSMSAGRHIFFGEKLCGLIKYSGNDEISRANEQSRILAAALSCWLDRTSPDELQALFELILSITDSNITAFDFENRKNALTKLLSQKDFSLHTVDFFADEKLCVTDKYTNSLSVYR